VSNGVNFVNDYKKDTYNKRIFIAKNIDDMNILATLKKHLYFLKCGILKFYKFKIASKILSLKSPLPYIN
jgi:hypothetical protein